MSVLVQCPYLPYLGAALSRGVCCNNFVAYVFQVAQHLKRAARNYERTIRTVVGLSSQTWHVDSKSVIVRTTINDHLAAGVHYLAQDGAYHDIRHGAFLQSQVFVSEWHFKSRFQRFEDYKFYSGCGRNILVPRAHHLSDLRQARALDLCRKSEGSWALGTRMRFISVPVHCPASLLRSLY